MASTNNKVAHSLNNVADLIVHLLDNFYKVKIINGQISK